MLSDIKKSFGLFSPRQKRVAVAILLLTLFSSTLEVLGIGAIYPFMAAAVEPKLLEKQGFLAWLYQFIGQYTHGFTGFLIALASLLIVIFVCKNAFLLLVQIVQTRFVYKHFTTLSKLLYGNYLLCPYEFHISAKVSVLMRNILTEPPLYAQSFMLPMMVLITELVFCTAIFGFLLWVSFSSALIVFFSLFFACLIFMWLLKQRLYQAGINRQRASDRMYAEVLDGLNGIKELKVLGRQQYFYQAFSGTARRFSRSTAFSYLAGQCPRLFVETVAVMVLLSVAIGMLVVGVSSKAVVIKLAIFAVAGVRLMPSLNKIMASLSSMRYSRAALTALVGELSKDYMSASLDDMEKQVITGEVAPIHVHNAVTLQDVRYTYPNASQSVLKGVDMSIVRHTTIGLVGDSGAGKTTLVDVLLGLLEPEQGVVAVDGCDIYQNLSAWQRSIGYIPQSIYLSNTTIRENIAFGIERDQADDAAIWRALKAAQLADFVDKLPGKLDTIVGEHGVCLSGGQRQRVGIARALYHNPDILIMDEATAALDNVTEQQFMDALKSLQGNKTIIIIAHRLTTVKACDEIHFMREGEVIASGTYDDLLAHCAPFQKLANASLT